MKRFTLIALILGVAVVLAAQEGTAYKNTAQVIEKSYDVRQAHGRDKLTLATKAIGTYNSNGIIVDKIIYKANNTFLGRISRNQSYNPYTLETLNYNNMNLLNSRSVEIAGKLPGEATIIEYDTKGKILNRTSNRIYEPTQEIWSMNHNQVGYVYHYFQAALDNNQRIQITCKYNTMDELEQKQYYTYDAQNQLISIVAMSASLPSLNADPALEDTLIYKKEFLYDDQGNLFEENLYDHKEKIVETERMVYDNKNRLIQKSFYIWNPRFGVVPNLRKQSDYEYPAKTTNAKNEKWIFGDKD
ncbi:MAG: hypothetical protein PHO32_08865 [Candidatus Cloacimonetes bacterium]|nr:hypothetical protein [Candidatus Cloacimonadota bacterium]